MIRTIEVNLNAAHPDIPLVEATAIVGSPSAAFIRRVPANIGSWTITSVYVYSRFPDNSTATVEAVRSAEGVWVATIPATEYSGRVTGGFQILADGIDENGDAITGYTLGIADLAVYTRSLTIQPGAVSYELHYFETAPNPAKKGDVATVNGALSLYTGAAWIAFDARAYAAAQEAAAAAQGVAQNLTNNYYTAAQTDAAINALAAYYITYNADGAAFPTRAALMDAQTVYSGGVERAPTRNDYAVVLADETHGGAEWRYIYAVADGATTGQWEPQYPIETSDYAALANKPKINNVTLSDNKTSANLGLLGLAGGMMTGTLVFSSSVGLPIYIAGDGPDSYAAMLNRDSLQISGVSGNGGTEHFIRLTAYALQIYDVSYELVAELTFPATSGTLALTSQLRYSFNTATVSTGTTPTVTNLLDRAVNSVTLGSSVAAATVFLPDATSGKARDFYLAVVSTGGAAPTFSVPGATLVNAQGGSADLTVGTGVTTTLHFTEISRGTSTPDTPTFLVTGGKNYLYTPLSGQIYDFATNEGLYAAVRDMILALGGSVTNFPALPSEQQNQQQGEGE